DHVDRARSFRAANATMDLTELADIFGPSAGHERSVLMDLYGTTSAGDGSERFPREVLAEVSVKNHYHGSLNPCAHRQQALTAQQVLGSRVVAGPLTRLMCAPFSDGAACLVLGSGPSRRNSADDVMIAASVLASGRGDDLRRSAAVVLAAREAYEQAGAGP